MALQNRIVSTPQAVTMTVVRVLRQFLTHHCQPQMRYVAILAGRSSPVSVPVTSKSTSRRVATITSC